MKRISLISIFVLIFSVYSSAQIYVDNQGNVYDQSKRTTQSTAPTTKQQVKSKSSFDARNLEFGGSLGMQFGNYTSVSISPQVGYRFSKYLSAGAGLGYSYFKDDWRAYNAKYTAKQHFASFNLYGNIYPVSFIVLSVKPEISRMWQTVEQSTRGSGKETYTKFVPSVVIGGGLRFGPMTAQVKYDVVQDDYSPYGNSIFYSIGYTFGF